MRRHLSAAPEAGSGADNGIRNPYNKDVHWAPGIAEVRLLFVFDPDREAIVLVAGDKAGRWNAWYAEAIPLAEERYAAYRQEAHEEEK